MAILYSDDTKKEFKSCYFLPSESMKSGQLDPSTESALSTACLYSIWSYKSFKRIWSWNGWF